MYAFWKEQCPPNGSKSDRALVQWTVMKGVMVSHVRHMQDKTTFELHRIFVREWGLSVSLRHFYRLRPYFVKYHRKRSLCCCVICLSFRWVLEGLHRGLSTIAHLGLGTEKVCECGEHDPLCYKNIGRHTHDVVWASTCQAEGGPLGHMGCPYTCIKRECEKCKSRFAIDYVSCRVLSTSTQRVWWSRYEKVKAYNNRKKEWGFRTVESRAIGVLSELWAEILKQLLGLPLHLFQGKQCMAACVHAALHPPPSWMVISRDYSERSNILGAMVGQFMDASRETIGIEPIVVRRHCSLECGDNVTEVDGGYIKQDVHFCIFSMKEQNTILSHTNLRRVLSHYREKKHPFARLLCCMDQCACQYKNCRHAAHVSHAHDPWSEGGLELDDYWNFYGGTYHLKWLSDPAGGAFKIAMEKLQFQMPELTLLSADEVYNAAVKYLGEDYAHNENSHGGGTPWLLQGKRFFHLVTLADLAKELDIAPAMESRTLQPVGVTQWLHSMRNTKTHRVIEVSETPCSCMHCFARDYDKCALKAWGTTPRVVNVIATSPVVSELELRHLRSRSVLEADMGLIERAKVGDMLALRNPEWSGSTTGDVDTETDLYNPVYFVQLTSSFKIAEVALVSYAFGDMPISRGASYCEAFFLNPLKKLVPTPKSKVFFELWDNASGNVKVPTKFRWDGFPKVLVHSNQILDEQPIMTPAKHKPSGRSTCNGFEMRPSDIDNILEYADSQNTYLS